MDEKKLVQDLLNSLAPSLVELSDTTGWSVDTLRAWKKGRRFPSPENLDRLVSLADERGKALQWLAKELRKVARRRK